MKKLAKHGGEEEDRTPDLRIANAVPPCNSLIAQERITPDKATSGQSPARKGHTRYRKGSHTKPHPWRVVSRPFGRS